MSDGTLNLPFRSTPPDSPNVGRFKIWVDSNDLLVKITDSDGVTSSFIGPQGPAGQDGVDGVDGQDGAQGIQGIQGPQGTQGPSGPMTVEGFIVKDFDTTLPNSSTKQVIFGDTISVSATGDCFLLVFLCYKPHSTSTDTEFDISFAGNVITRPELVEEHKDTSNAQSVWRMGNIKLDGVTAGSKNIQLRYSKESTGGSAVLKYYTAMLVRYN